MRWKDNRKNEPFFLTEEASSRPVSVRVAVRNRRRTSTPQNNPQQHDSQFDELLTQKKSLLTQIKEVDQKRAVIRSKVIGCEGGKNKGKQIAKLKLDDAQLLAERQAICAQMGELKQSLRAVAAERRALEDVTAFKFMKAAKICLEPELFDQIMKKSQDE